MRVLKHDEFRVTDEMLASKGTRFGNYIIDRIVSTLFAYLVFIIVALLFSFLGYDDILYDMEHINPILDWVLTASLIMVYYFLMEYFFAKSLGKFLTKTTVVNEKGEKPEAYDIIIRSLSRIVPFEPFSFLGEDAYGWHDKWSETYVVKDSVFQEHKTAFEEFKEIGNTNDSPSEFEAFLKE